MRRFFLAFLLLVVGPRPGLAQSAGTIPLNGTPDAIWGATDCSTVAGSTTVTCPARTFSTIADKNKIVIIDDAADDGAGNRIPYIGTILSGTGNTFVVQASGGAIPNFATPITHVTSFAIDTTHLGSGYHFGSKQTLQCNGCTVAARNNSSTHGGTAAFGTPGLLQAVLANATPVNAGSGGPAGTGTCVVTLSDQFTLGGGTTRFTATLNGSRGVASITTTPLGNAPFVSGFTSSASYSPSDGTYTESLSGCGGLTGATVKASYGVALEQIENTTPGAGLYRTLPDCLAPDSTGVNSDDFGTSLRLFCDTTPTSTTSWGTDNTSAFTTALGTMNADSASANPRCVYIPGGNYMTDVLNTGGASGTGLAKGYGCWLGDEHYQSNVFVVPRKSGDLFGWLDANRSGAQVNFAATQYFSDIYGSPVKANQAGSSFRNITVIGDRSMPGIDQNALVFYGKTSFAYIDNIVVSYMKGSALAAGFADTSTNSWGNITESRIQNAHFDHDGDGANFPSFEMTAVKTEGSNNIVFGNCPCCMVIHGYARMSCWAARWVASQELATTVVH